MCCKQIPAHEGRFIEYAEHKEAGAEYAGQQKSSEAPLAIVLRIQLRQQALRVHD